MKLKWIYPLASALCTLVVSGCYTSTDGEKHAGVPFYDDRVEGRYEKTPSELWTAAKDVLKHQGSLTGEDTLKMVMQGSIDERKIWVKVEEWDSKVTRVIVQARTKGGGADKDMAAFVDKQIAVRLAAGNLTPSAPVHR